MVKAVTVTQYQSDDGTMHGSKEMAEFHDKNKLRDMMRDKIEEVIFNTLSSWGPLYQLEDKIDTYEYRSITKEIIDSIIDNWEELKEVMED